MSKQESPDELAEALIGGDPSAAKHAEDALVHLGEAAIPPLMRLLREEGVNRVLRRDLIPRVLARVGKPAVEPLIDSLASKDPSVRYGALFALSIVRDLRAFDPSARALRDEDADVRSAAAHTVGALGDPRAAGPLVQALGDDDREVRGSAALALGELRAQEAVDPLLEVLGNRTEYPSVRAYAARALGSLGAARAAQFLVDALSSDDPWVTDSARDALIALGTAAIDNLMKGLSERERGVPAREVIAYILLKLRDPRAIGTITTILKDQGEDTRLRASIAAWLGRLGVAAAADSLIAVVADADATVREKAVESLSVIGDAGAVRALETVAQLDSAETVRATATRSLRRIKKRLGLPLPDEEDPDGTVVRRFGRFHLHRVVLFGPGNEETYYRLGVSLPGADRDFGSPFPQEPSPREIYDYIQRWLQEQPKALSELERQANMEQDSAKKERFHRSYADRKRLLQVVEQAFRESGTSFYSASDDG
jgi:HEAT repeat protein